MSTKAPESGCSADRCSALCSVHFFFSFLLSQRQLITALITMTWYIDNKLLSFSACTKDDRIFLYIKCIHSTTVNAQCKDPVLQINENVLVSMVGFVHLIAAKYTVQKKTNAQLNNYKIKKLLLQYFNTETVQRTKRMQDIKSDSLLFYSTNDEITNYLMGTVQMSTCTVSLFYFFYLFFLQLFILISS